MTFLELHSLFLTRGRVRAGPSFQLGTLYSRRLRLLYSCAAPHILTSPAFHTTVLALRAAIYCGRTDGLTRDMTATDTTRQPAILPINC